jgi:hypothetical protein
MWILLLWWTIGVLVRFLFAWAFDPGFSLKQSLKNIVVSVVIGAIPAYALYKVGVSTWPIYILLAVTGFLSQYIIEWLNKHRS